MATSCIKMVLSHDQGGDCGEAPGHSLQEAPDRNLVQLTLQNLAAVCRVKAVTVVKLLATFFIGLVTGAAGAGLAAAQEHLYHTKNNAAREIIHDGLPHGILRAFVFHLAYTETLVLIGASLVRAEPPHLHIAQTVFRCCIPKPAAMGIQRQNNWTQQHPSWFTNHLTCCSMLVLFAALWAFSRLMSCGCICLSWKTGRLTQKNHSLA